MQHVIPIEKLDSSGKMMARAVEKCVHCGFCLATCPTYKILGEEMDSPRGRIILMKTVLEEDISLEEALPYIDRCLGCMACIPACPSGVAYDELLTPFRFYAEERREHSFIDKVAKKIVLETLPYPNRFRWAAMAGRAAKPVKSILPGQFQAMLALLPESVAELPPLPKSFAPKGKRRARVALLTGCVQQVIVPEINWATIRVLAHNGVEVLIPKGQSCCGALSMHCGDAHGARKLASQNFKAFPDDVDAIITNAAGCGSGMKEYSLLFENHPLGDQANSFSMKVMDISEFLADIGIIEPPPLPAPQKLAYHDACHLSHAQGITLEPRALLKRIPNLELVPIPESELCCGSAGIYNIEHPQTAAALGKRKAENIISAGASGVVMGNIGCMVQVRSSLANLGQEMRVLHIIEVLDRAYHEGH